MQVIYAFVYYFVWTFICLTALLLVFAFPPARRMLHKIQTRFQELLNNRLFQALINFSFAVFAIILIDSIKCFLPLNVHFK